MAGNNDNDLLDDLDGQVEKESRAEKRIKDLSEKVRLTSEERDAAKKAEEEHIKEIEGLKKERDFLSSFGEQVTKYPDAVSFQDKIKERVLKGYSIEDATVTVLNAEGKLFKKEAPPQMPAGGSAPITSPTLGEKKPSDMTREEKRNALIEAEKRGDIGIS